MNPFACQLAASELATALERTDGLRAFVGLDGFIDKILAVVGTRHGPGDAFEPMPAIRDFADRIGAAAGRSTNIELYLKLEKLGGNGPIMANALRAGGVGVRYAGALGRPVIHPLFGEFAEATDAISLAQPGVTEALEFGDGKIMLGTMASLSEITFDRLLECAGHESLVALFEGSDIVAMVNWTMLPHKTEILRQCLEQIWPEVDRSARQRVIFFDLADPQKRSQKDLRAVLEVIGQHREFGRVVLGLNLTEGLCVNRVLGFPDEEESPEALRRIASRIRQRLDIAAVVIHPVQGAAGATLEESAWVDGPVCQNPLITTGAGDHFNAGFVTAYALGMSLASSLLLGTCYSGQYVRTAKSPEMAETQAFLARGPDPTTR